ncbi:PRC-barrel domain-containing protein [Streptomyces sp. NPDC085946]|uniref:PRC-barrel domain-containing protein n=1 Tax=Streptomyces sp. NPDC085946 TaxID=3365744 RepID=UPI0037D40738
MMLFSQVRGLPVLTAGGERIGVLKTLTVDARAGTVTHVRVRERHARRETVLPWAALYAVGPDAVLVRPAVAPHTVPPLHDVLGRQVLTERGEGHGTVLDVAFDPATGRTAAVYTTLGALPADRLLGLGDHALVVRAA